MAPMVVGEGDPPGFFPWDPSFETGLAEIDSQHQDIVRLLNAVAQDYTAEESGKSFERLIPELLATLEHHFTTEEAVWESGLGKEDTWCLAHAEKHAGYLAQLRQLLRREMPVRDLEAELFERLYHWLVCHILVEDQTMAHVLHGLKSGLPVAEAKSRSGSLLGKQDRRLVSAVLALVERSFADSLRALVERQQAHRSRDAAELDTMRARLDSLLAVTPDAILVAEAETGRIVNGNAAAAELFGLTLEKLTSCRFKDLHPAHVHAFVEKEFAAICARFVQGWKPGTPRPGNHLVETVIRHSSGREIPVEIHANSSREEDGRHLLVAVIRDISHRSQLERELHLLKAAVESSALPMALMDAGRAENPIVYVNPAFLKVTGHPAEEVLGRGLWFLQTAHQEAGPFDQALQEGRAENLLLRTRRRDGSLFWNDASLSPVRDSHGKITHFILILSDVTERLQAQDELEGLFQNMAQGVVYHDPEGRITKANSAAVRLLGLSEKELMGRTSHNPEWRAIHEDGSPWPGSEHPAMVALRTGQPVTGMTMGVFNPQLRHYVWLIVSAHPEFRPGETRPHRIFSTFSDITERKMAEGQLEGLFQNMAQGIIYQDPSGRLMRANPAAERILGLTVEEIAGRSSMDPRWKTFHEDGSVFHPNEYPVLIAQRTGRPVIGKVMGILHAGKNECVWALVSAYPEFRPGEDQPFRVIVSLTDITERKKAEEELESARKALEKTALEVTENIPVGTYVLQGLPGERPRLTFVSRRWLEMLGLDRDSIGAEPAALLGLLHPADRESFEASNDKAVRSRTNFEWEGRAVIGGEIRWLHVESVFRKTPEGLSIWEGVMTDVTSRKAMESELERNREHLSRLLQHLKAAVVVHAPDTSILMANEEATRLLGLTWEQLQGREAVDPRWRFVHEDETPYEVEEYPVVRTIATGQPLENIVIGIDRPATGDRVWVLVNAFPEFDAGVGLRQVVVTFVDITERKRADEEHLAREAAQAEGRARLAFLARMSHEIRTPLTAIIGFSRILERTVPEGTPAAGHIHTITGNAEHLLSMVNELLEFGRIDAGDTRANSDEVRLAELLKDLEDLFAHRAGEKGIAFEVRAAADAPHRFRADALKLRQILINLVGNAIKFTHTGRVEVAVQKAVGKDGRRLIFEVRDTGPGISPDELPRLFDDYFVGETGRAAGGTGLGLPICKSLVHILGGSLEVESREGRGSVFRFTLPLLVEPGRPDHDTRPVDLPPRSSRPAATAASLASLPDLPPDVAERLRSAILEGDISTLRNLVQDEVTACSPLLAAAFRPLLESYDYAGLLKVLAENPTESSR